ncbi:MAG: lipoprotein-releasing ABC transporter permease subunit [Candidatus Methylacidiphilales bacterium]
MHLPFPLFLALRFLQPRRSFVSIITVVSLLGVLLGVAVLIVVVSVMRGFEVRLREKLIGFNAHLTVTNYAVLAVDQPLLDVVQGDRDVLGATPFVTGPVLAEHQNRMAAMFIKGIDPETVDRVIPIRETLKEGEWLLGPDAVLVGAEWAKRYGARVGDTISLLSPRNFESLHRGGDAKTETAYYLPSEYVIAGIFQTGFFEYDFNFLLLELGEAQKLYNLGDGVHGLAIRVKDPIQANQAKERINARLAPPAEAVTWMDQNRRLMEAVVVERRVIAFLLFFVMLVAAFGLMSTLITVTVQKASEIGLLKAIGAQAFQVVAVFTLYGFTVGLVGSGIGVLTGLSLLRWRNEFSDWLARTLNIEIFPAEIYNFEQIPAVLDPAWVLWISVAGIGLSTVAALIPAWLAARVDPVRTLHGE